MKGPARKPIDQRFWQRVHKTAYCWLWVGRSRHEHGYGMLGRGGRGGGMVGAHRVSWEIHNGPIPEGAVVCHRCDNPRCVNPAHLFIGTQAENLLDARQKGRIKPPESRGERNGNAKLSAGDVAAIRAAYKAGETQTAIAKRYGVWQTQISMIVRGRHWPIRET